MEYFFTNSEWEPVFIHEKNDGIKVTDSAVWVFFLNLFSSLICLKTPWPGSSLGSSSCAGAASGASEEDKLVQRRSPVSSFSGTELLLD